MSTPTYRLISPQAGRSFVFKWEHFNLTTRWHYHPEVELIYFIEGKTNAIIGDGFYDFSEGDLVILGANFPHVLQENKSFVQENPSVRPFGLIIQFTEDFLGKDFMVKPELHEIKTLLNKARNGVHFKKHVVEKVKHALLNMHTLSETRKLFSLLEVLQTLTESDSYELMTNRNYEYVHLHDEERMRSVYQYLYENFTKKITVSEIAAIANMTETSFCRYFKSRTLKNFTRFVNEIRIAYACKLLSNKNYTATSACYESGFNELSYFTRQFKSIMKMSPIQYRRRKLEVTT